MHEVFGLRWIGNKYTFFGNVWHEDMTFFVRNVTCFVLPVFTKWWVFKFEIIFNDVMILEHKFNVDQVGASWAAFFQLDGTAWNLCEIKHFEMNEIRIRNSLLTESLSPPLSSVPIIYLTYIWRIWHRRLNWRLTEAVNWRLTEAENSKNWQ